MKPLPQFRALAATALLSWVCGVALAQDSGQSAALGDVARQARAQKQSSNEAAPNKAQELADQLQQEQEETESAPTGFKTYKAGDYRLWVPSPYEIEGRDYFGTVLAGSSIGIANTEVMAGNPIPIPQGYSDNKSLFTLTIQIAQQYGQAGCIQTKLGDRKAFRCDLNSAHLLDRQVFGELEVIVVSNTLIPIVCATPDDANAHYVYSNSNTPYKQLRADWAKQTRQLGVERTTAQVCDQVVYPSIRFKEDDVAMATAKSNENGRKPAKPTETKGLAIVPSPAAALVAAARTPVQGSPSSVAGAPSLADLARQTKQNSTQQLKPKLTLDGSGDGVLVPVGMKAQSFRYCKESNCWDASFFVPANAVLVNSDYSEFVFQVPLGDDKVLLYAGPAGIGGVTRLSSDPKLVQWEEMNDPEGWIGLGKTQAVTHNEATIAGKPGILIHFEFKKTNATYAGVRATVESHGVVVLVGCMVPKNRFGDADEICSGLIDSLRLP